MERDCLHPWRFAPITVEKPWAGRRLARLFPELADEIPAGTGEVIVLSQLPGADSLVRGGPAHDKPLSELMRAFHTEVLGELRHGSWLQDFPLAVKFLDTLSPLSVQVHPRDETDADGLLTRRGKGEAWLVLEADETSMIYQGVRSEVAPEHLESALGTPALPGLLHTRRVARGEWLGNPAGMIHAVGAGLALLEIQQNCGVTYRLYDFPRHDQPKRELQMDAGFRACLPNLPLPAPVNAATAPTLEHAPHVALLQEPTPGLPFGVRMLRFEKPAAHSKEWPGFTVFVCLKGSLELACRGGDMLHPTLLRQGDVLLAPAIYNGFEFYPNGVPCKLVECFCA